MYLVFGFITLVENLLTDGTWGAHGPFLSNICYCVGAGDTYFKYVIQIPTPLLGSVAHIQTHGSTELVESQINLTQVIQPVIKLQLYISKILTAHSKFT